MASTPDFLTPYRTTIRPYGKAALDGAVEIIRSGGCVAVPTETVYGLAADATQAQAVAGIYAAKGRPSFNPLIVHVPDLAAAEKIALFNAAARDLAVRYWPGPLTMVLPLKPGASITSLVTAGLSTVAIRVPAHPVMRDLLNAAACPLAAPSANASGGISPTRALHAAKSLAGRIPLVIDGGACDAGIESTIVAVDEIGALRLLRPGPIDLGLPLAHPAGSIEAPGQMESHYAPQTPLRLHAQAPVEGEYMIGFGAVAGDDTLSTSGDLVEAAANLFACLHAADASGAPGIAIAPIPNEGLGLAINDRLRRAAVRQS
jgi:L-threonylcarbamoyladenylate synthase